MKPSDDIHWTDDPELIEKFVLHQLNPEERNELEDHLRICEVCKRALRSEQVLLAGIRRSGRERFRATLAKKLPRATPAAIPWPHILSAAAIIILLTGIGIYNRWFQAVQPIEVPPSTTPSLQSLPADSVQDLDDVRPLMEMGSPSSEEEATAAQRGEGSPSQPAPQDRDVSNTASLPHARRNGEAPLPHTSEKPAHSASTPAPRVAADASGPPPTRASDDQQGTFWVIGIVTPNEGMPSTLASEAEQFQAKVRKQAEVNIGQGATVIHRLEQQPISALPLAQQNLVGPDKPLAAIRKEGDRYVVTLYREHPLAPGASLVQRGDSLIVHTGEVQFSFVIPPELQRRQQEPGH